MRRLSLAILLSFCATAADRPPVPRFADPARRARLETAFPQVTAVFEKFWRDRGAPGLAFGVVIDGELALVKAYGLRDRDSKDHILSIAGRYGRHPPRQIQKRRTNASWFR